ncbi:MAG: hypothetical protein F6K24_08140 [Okeania sp. SIO2D1]|nr:hypothetical protein [Okeania sp. SIO2D1]
MRMVLQAHVKGSSLRGISRTVNLAYNTVVSLVRAASQKGLMVHIGWRSPISIGFGFARRKENTAAQRSLAPPSSSYIAPWS